MSFAGRLVYVDGILRSDVVSSEPEAMGHGDDLQSCYAYLPTKTYPKAPPITILEYRHGVLIRVYESQPFRLSEKPPTYLRRADCHNIRCVSR
jgi:hypothetical protein